MNRRKFLKIGALSVGVAAINPKLLAIDPGAKVMTATEVLARQSKMAIDFYNVMLEWSVKHQAYLLSATVRVNDDQWQTMQFVEDGMLTNHDVMGEVSKSMADAFNEEGSRHGYHVDHNNLEKAIRQRLALVHEDCVKDV